MSTKLILLKSGETIISDIKEILSETAIPRKAIAYMLNKPHKIFIQKGIFLSEEVEKKGGDQTEVQVVLTDWIPLTEENEIVIPVDWVVTIVDPISAAKQMYEEKVNGESN